MIIQKMHPVEIIVQDKHTELCGFCCPFMTGIIHDEHFIYPVVNGACCVLKATIFGGYGEEDLFVGSGDVDRGNIVRTEFCRSQFQIETDASH